MMQYSVHPREIDPRPPFPPTIPVNAQTWESLSLLHWTLPADRVQALLPEGLIVDEYEGRTWLGVVPFVMSAVRVPPLPDLGRFSTFPELNVRVYVHDLEGNRGVWFLGLWCSHAGFVASARALGLPYHRVQGHVRPAEAGDCPPGQGAELSYRFLRSGGRTTASSISFSATVRSGEPVDASSGLEAWLTARWNMFARTAGRLWRFPVHHEPWRLQTAAVEDLRMNAHDRFGLVPPQAPPLVHVADPVHALISAPRPCRAR